MAQKQEQHQVQVFPEDPAPKGFTGLMTMFIMYIYDDIIKATLGKNTDRFA